MEMLQGPFVAHLENIEEIVKEIQKYTNVDIEHFGIKMTNFKVFGDSQNHFHGKGHVYPMF